MSDDTLKNWVRKELVSNTSVGERVLSEYKEVAKTLLTINDHGKIVVYKSDLTARLKIGLYLVGAAYAKIAELREDDSVSNKEIIEELKLKKGTVDPALKSLREEGLAVQKGSGLHHINYAKIKDLFEETKA